MPTYLDQMGNSIELPALPKRIVSIVPSQTELLFDLGLDETILAITRYGVHPEAKVQGRTLIGGTKNPDLAKIRALQPDLIIGNKEENRQEDIEALQKEFPVWVSDVNNLTDATAMIRSVGIMVGKETSAEWIANRIEKRFAELATGAMPVLPSKRPKVAYLIWRKPWMVAGAGTFIDNMLHHAGFSNVFAAQARYPAPTEEDLKNTHPDWVFLASEPYPFNEASKAEIQALWPDCQIKLVDGELFSWYGSRLLRMPDYLRGLHDEMTQANSTK